MSLSPEQLEQRSTRIAATDISCILGVNPYRSAVDVWLEKTGHGAPFIGNDRTKWGSLLEQPIRADYEERHGVRVEVPGTLISRHRDWQAATPDGIVYRGGCTDPDRGLEIKAHSRQAMFTLTYGDPGTDEVPMHELCQSMWNIDVVEVPRWDLVVFDGTPTEYVIDQDDELIGMMREAGERFLVDHVKANIPPPPDGSERYAEWLTDRWKANGEDFVDVATNTEILAAVEELREKRLLAADLEARIEVITQQIKAVIGENAGIVWTPERKNSKPGSHRITWKRSKEGTHTDHLGMLLDVRATAALVGTGSAVELDAIEQALTKIGGGYIGNTTLSGAALVKVIQRVRATLTGIARGDNESSYIKSKPGNRPFNVPRTWKSTKESE